MANKGRVFPKGVFGMSIEDEIRNKAYELGQKYFPNANNVWARANIEAQYVSSACTEMAEWMQKKMIEKATQWLFENVFYYPDESDRVELFRKAMKE